MLPLVLDSYWNSCHLIPSIKGFLLVSFADSGGMPERPCVLTGMPESIEWVLISFLSFLLLSLLPDAVLCQWCYSVSHTSKCWPRETWGPQEHRASWSDALNRAPQRLFFSCSLNSLQKLLWNPPLQGEVALRAPRMQFSNCTFQDTELSCWRALLFSPSFPHSYWDDHPSSWRRGCMRPPKPVGATPE